MKIVSFKCQGLHRYLDLQVVFNEDLTLLVGINGSGKTSVVRAIVSLLQPDLIWLSTTQFGSIEVQIEHGDTAATIGATLEGERGTVRFQSGLIDEAFEFDAERVRRLHTHQPEFSDDEEEILSIESWQREAILDTAAFKAIRDLPTPIYLGLERTTLIQPMRAGPRARPRPSKGIRAPSDGSISQAIRLAEGIMRDRTGDRNRIMNQLRQEIILTIFKLTEDTVSVWPDKNTVRRYTTFESALIRTLERLGFTPETIGDHVTPFFVEMKTAFKALSEYDRFPDAVQAANKDPTVMQELQRFFAIQPRLNILDELESIIRSANNREAELFAPLNTYLEIVNSFLEDSGKALNFSESGDIQTRLPSGDTGSPFDFSSGERQIFVLLTHLMFNRLAHLANVLIIDEPELSLHIKWQEIFIDAVQQARPQLQIILATHSPSIIMDRDEKCRDLSFA